jgi:hypothetical protein
MTYRLVVAAPLVAAVFLIGCADQKKTSTQRSPAPTDSTPASATEDHSKGPELSDEDKALVAAQRLCPVTDEDLMADAEMGGPVKLVVKGETVFICCKGCEKKLRADEDAMLIKVAELKKAAKADDASGKN